MTDRQEPHVPRFTFHVSRFIAVTLGLVLLLSTVLAGCDDPTPAQPATLQATLVTQPYPPRTGINTKFLVTVTDAQGKPLDGAKVSVETLHIRLGQNGPGGELEAQGGGQYLGEGTFTVGGTWRIAIAVSKPGYNTAEQEIMVAIK